MSSPSLWNRIRQARVVQVLVVYLGASWVVLQLADVLQETAGLPSWVGAFTLLLLAIGLVVVMATAWVQSLPSTTAREEAGEIPTDWQVAPSDVVASLKAGRLPHLTWGRAILGGAFALLLLFAGAGLYALITGDDRARVPAQAGAEELATGVAVLPFSVSGAELELYREGMVDLLSTNFDGVGGFRTIDSRTVLARWDEEVGGDARPDLGQALRAAGRTGARYAVLGSLVPAGSEIRLSIDVYDLEDGTEVGTTRVEGSPDDILALVDELSVGLARELLGASGQPLASDQRLASITTSSLDALEDFLEGERLHREGSFEAAEEAFARAIAIDSLFALAWARLAAASGWTPGLPGPYTSAEARAVAYRLRDRLSPREARLVEAVHLYNENRPEGIDLLRDHLRRHPDEAEAWYNLADYYLHRPGLDAAPREEVREIVERAAALDPGFAPYQIHLVDLAFAAADSAAARSWIDSYWAAGGESNLLSDAWETGFDILFGDDEARARGYEVARGLPQPQLALGVLAHHTDRPGLAIDLLRMAHEKGVVNTWGLARGLRRAGRWQEARGLLANRSAWPQQSDRVEERVLWHEAYGLGDVDEIHNQADALPCDGLESCWRRAWVKAEHATHDGHPTEAAEALAEAKRYLAIARDSLDADDYAAAEQEHANHEIGVRLLAGDAAGAFAAWREREGRYPVDFLGMARAADAIGDVDAAERYYLAEAWDFSGPEAVYRLAQLYERTGRTQDALAQYEKLLVMWEAADEDFPPLLEVREAVARLGGGDSPI